MYKRIIIKIGTKVLSTKEGRLDVALMKRLVEEVVAQKKSGTEVVLVTSGAMGAGRGLITPTMRDETARKQVLAAVGQVQLMSTYAELFKKHGELCAQVLVTKEDFRDRTHYLNMRNCFENLLTSGVIPVANENDVVATTELLFTDNDELAGLIASELNADAVILLTSAKGFIAGDPSDKKAKVIAEINCAGHDTCEKYIAPEKTSFGRGGMLTKFTIAKKLALQGITVHIADGKRRHVLSDILSGKAVGTKFLPQSGASAIKRRLAYSEGLTKGTVRVNQGAENLLRSKQTIISLLPVGIIGVDGSFEKGDIVAIVGEKKQKLGFGVAQYGAEKARELMGVKNARPLIHYNYMFISA
ncbi:MAG: Glutamate 5-kinase [Parcubacteria group bacterium GW2011_GWA2_49_9]|nr:MAG: Glutamate 5-kinase [Parcubacteria group bacterium GW2011_GWA2_49_9]